MSMMNLALLQATIFRPPLNGDYRIGTAHGLLRAGCFIAGIVKW